MYGGVPARAWSAAIGVIGVIGLVGFGLYLALTIGIYAWLARRLRPAPARVVLP